MKHEHSEYVSPLVQPEETPIQALEKRLADLVRAYVRERRPLIAKSVVQHLDWLLKHPEYGCDSTHGFAYLRLRRHWQMLAVIEHKVGISGT